MNTLLSLSFSLSMPFRGSASANAVVRASMGLRTLYTGPGLIRDSFGMGLMVRSIVFNLVPGALRIRLDMEAIGELYTERG